MDRAGRQSALMDVLERVLDKGIVIDAGIRISVIGIDVVGVQAKITVASIETYLNLAEDVRAYDLGLIGAAPRRSTEEELERLTAPKKRAGREAPPRPAAPAARAAPPADARLPLAAYYDEELSTNRPEETEPPEQT